MQAKHLSSKYIEFESEYVPVCEKNELHIVGHQEKEV